MTGVTGIGLQAQIDPASAQQLSGGAAPGGAVERH